MASSKNRRGPGRDLVVRANDAPKVARPLAPDEEKGGLDFGAVWNTLRSGKWLILSCVAAACLAAIAYSLLVTPTYQAAAVVSVGARGVGLPVDGAEIAINQAPLVGSEKSMLEKSSDLPVRVYETLASTAESLGTTEFFPLLASESEADVRPVWEAISDRMSFETVGVEMIMISATSSSPQEAMQLSNIFAQEYRDQSRERSRASIVAARQFLETQVAASEEMLAELERQWETYSRARNMVAQGQGGERTVAEYASLLARRDEVQLQLRGLRVQQETTQQRLNAVEPESATTNTARIELELGTLAQQIQARTLEAQAWYLNDATLRGDEGREPQLKAIVDEIAQLERRHADLEAQIVQESVISPVAGVSPADFVSQLRSSLIDIQLQIRTLEADEANTNERIAVVGSQMDQIPAQVFEVESMERRRNNEYAYLDQLKSTLRRYNIAEQAELGFVEVVRSATIPSQPVAPDLQGNLIMALLLGTFFGAGLAFLKTAVNTHLQSPDDVEHLGYRLLGVIPSMHREIRDAFKGKREVEINGKVRSAALVTLHSPWSPAAEHYRLVRTNLQSIAKDLKLEVILVTSPEPNDGKTISTVNMAISIANNGSRTLIIDCDLRKASIARTLGVRRSPGVGEMLTDGEVITDFEPFKTDIENLSCIPGGRITTPPPELLGSDTMQELINSARKHFDIVIIDSPPVLAVTDAVVLAPFCDAAVIVVAANKTSPRGVRTTITTLENLGVTIAGVVFNQYDLGRSAAGYYGYQYGYAYAGEAES